MSDEITVVQGDDYENTVAVTDADGNPVDLTGAKLWFTIKKKPDDDDANAVVQYDSEGDPNNIWVEGAATNGIIGFLISASDSKDIAPRSYYYDFQVKLSSGKIHTPLRGNITITWQVTKATT